MVQLNRAGIQMEFVSRELSLLFNCHCHHSAQELTLIAPLPLKISTPQGQKLLLASLDAMFLSCTLMALQTDAPVILMVFATLVKNVANAKIVEHVLPTW